MSSTQDTAVDDGAEVNDRTYAAFSVVDEHRRLSEVISGLVAVIDDIQNGRESVNIAVLSKATERTTYDSRRKLTDGLLFAVSIDDKSPIDDGVIEAIAKSGDEAAALVEQLDAEIKAEGGAARGTDGESS